MMTYYRAVIYPQHVVLYSRQDSSPVWHRLLSRPARGLYHAQEIADSLQSERHATDYAFERVIYAH